MSRLIPIITAGLLTVAGCKPGAESAPPIGGEDFQRAQQQIAEERAKREAAEARTREQESRASWWQCAALIGFGLVTAALLAGAILGSRARHDAKP